MKMVKCDRCGTIDDGLIFDSINGYESIYTGVILVSTVDEPESNPIAKSVDLCRKCAAEFQELARKFMKIGGQDEL